MNLGGAAQGYLNYVQDDRAAQTQDVQRRIMLQQLLQAQSQQQARDQALGAQQKWGSVLQGMMGGGQPMQPGGLPPVPGTPQGGPMPPPPGTSSAPPTGMAPPPMQGPPGAIPPPPAGQGLTPPFQPGGTGAPAQAAPMPYKPMPNEPGPQRMPMRPTDIPAPPQQMGAPGAPPAMGGQQWGLPQLLDGLKKANVPPDQWGAMLDNLPEPIKNNAAQEIRTLRDQQNFLIQWAKEQTGERAEKRRADQGDRKLDQGDEKIAIAKELAEQKVQDAIAGRATTFDDTDRTYWRTVLQKGGTLPPGLARSNSGRAFVQSLMRDVAHGDVAPEDMMANQAGFAGEKAGQRTLGTRTANIEMAATEADQLADLALKASGELKRTGIKSLNDAIQAAEKRTASPELRRFVAANTSFINAYARAINPQGVGTVADKEHAREMLDTAFSKGDYTAVIDQLKAEIGAAKASPGIVKGEMRDRFVGGGSRKQAPPEAIEYLKTHPELSGDFSKKYGYLPGGARAQ